MTKDELGVMIINKITSNVREMEQIKNKSEHTQKDLIKAAEMHGFNDGVEWVIEMLSETDQ